MAGKNRKLSGEEIELAKTVFGDAIDYEAVRISARRIKPFQPKNGGLCTGNTINISGSAYCQDYTTSDRTGLRAFFIHEMTHIWQYQNSPAYFGRKLLKELTKHHFNYMAKAYRYELVDGKPFDDYGLEQQACIVQDYFALKSNACKGMSGQCYSQLTKEQLLPKLQQLVVAHFAQQPQRNCSTKTKPPKFKKD